MAKSMKEGKQIAENETRIMRADGCSVHNHTTASVRIDHDGIG